LSLKKRPLFYCFQPSFFLLTFFFLSFSLLESIVNYGILLSLLAKSIQRRNERRMKKQRKKMRKNKEKNSNGHFSILLLHSPSPQIPTAVPPRRLRQCRALAALTSSTTLSVKSTCLTSTKKGHSKHADSSQLTCKKTRTMKAKTSLVLPWLGRCHFFFWLDNLPKILIVFYIISEITSRTQSWISMTCLMWMTVNTTPWITRRGRRWRRS